jgi:hypothetical protein
MKYFDGKFCRLGDRVLLAGRYKGIIVSDIDNDHYSKSNAREQWSYLKRGVMVEFEDIGLVHYEEPEMDLILVSRDPGVTAPGAITP